MNILSIEHQLYVFLDYSILFSRANLNISVYLLATVIATRNADCYFYPCLVIVILQLYVISHVGMRCVVDDCMNRPHKMDYVSNRLMLNKNL